jgi:LysR family glycine cleavage system transcriptional activator
MTPHLPSLRALAALEAVIRHGNIVRAANELRVTPGAVSKQIQNLEAALGAALFDEGHRLQPTAIGLQLARSSGTALALLRQAWSEASQKADTRVLTVIAHASLCIYWLVPRVLAMQTALNGRPVRVTALHVADDWQRLPVDFAVLRDSFVPQGWRSHPVGTETHTLLATPERAENALRHGVAALTEETFLVARSRDDELDPWLAAAGLDTNVNRHYHSHFYVALEAALAGAGMIVGPENLLSDLIRQGRLVVATPNVRIDGAPLTAVYNPSTCDERTAQRLFKWLQADLAGL